MSRVEHLEDEIRVLVGGILELDPGQIEGDARLVQDLGMDSMMALEIIASLEKKYKIKLPEQELQNVTTVNRVIELTQRYVQ
jgi:acyl carrier protein